MRLSSRHAVIGISAIILFFLYRMVILGEIPLASDTIASRPISKWATDYLEREGTIPQWYPHLFGGMPSYGGYVFTPADPVVNLLKPLFVNRGVRYWFHFVVGGIGMFFFLRRRKLSMIPSMFGVAVWSLTPYLFGLINAGHSSKINALSYLPLLLLAVDHIFDTTSRRAILYLALVTALQLWARHPQVVYYTWMLVVFLWLWRQVGAIAKKRWSPRREGLQTVILIGGLMLALILVADPYVSLFEFQGHSTRGGSSVLDASGDTEKGTRWDYATQWSFHPKELISFVYPYFYGLENYPTRDLKSAAYWGYMPFTQSTHYLGLLTLLLAILGLTVRKPGQFTTSMAAASVIIIVIGFGKYFPVLFWPLFKFAPFFSKFRIPSMIYVLLPLTVGIVAAGGMDTVISGLKERKHEFINRLRIRTSVIFGAVIVGSLLLLVIGKPVYDGLGFFVKSGDASRFRPEILPQVRQIRHDVFQKGLLLSLFIGSGGLAAIWLGIRRTVSGGAVGLVLVGLTIGDLWVVDREFLHLKNPASMRHQFRATPEVNFLLKDHDLFRIFPLDDFNSNWYAYFGLSSIGGYRPVKLRTYQDLMDAGGLNSLPVLNMLNVKYVITGRNISLPGLERVFEGKQFVYRNMSVLPKAWLVYEVESVSSPRESLRKTIDPDFDPSTEAIVINYTGPPLASGGSGTTRVDHYSENQIVLETSSSEGGLAVLSENYYGPGWKATMDGQPAQIFQTNHILRSVYVPAGEHTITYRYDTSRFRLARMISRMSLTLLIVAIGWIHRRDLVRIASRFAKKA